MGLEQQGQARAEPTEPRLQLSIRAHRTRLAGSGTADCIVEAMACGTAVVAAEVETIPELATHECCALLVPACDPTAVAQAPERLSTKPALGSGIASTALGRCSGSYPCSTAMTN